MYCFDDHNQAWGWEDAASPTTFEVEREFIDKGRLSASNARYQLKEQGTGTPVQLHTASIRWNPFRGKFVLIGLEVGSDVSCLGEVWYSEADSITGPWRKGVKIVSHPNYSFYNVVHHFQPRVR